MNYIIDFQPFWTIALQVINLMYTSLVDNSYVCPQGIVIIHWEEPSQQAFGTLHKERLPNDF